MKIKEAVEMLRENLFELPPNTVEYNCGYADAIRDLENMIYDEVQDNDKA